MLNSRIHLKQTEDKNKGIVVRLIHYKNALRRLWSLGIKKVISDNLAEMIGVSPSQVRSDFAHFKIAGKRRGGYQISELLAILESVLTNGEVQQIILVGVGHLGKAFLNYKGFEKENIKIVAGFDIKPIKIDSSGFTILSMEKLEQFIKKHSIRVAILAIPLNDAQLVAEQLIAYGIKGILNFTPLLIKSTPECIVNNIDLSLVLEQLTYTVNAE